MIVLVVLLAVALAVVLVVGGRLVLLARAERKVPPVAFIDSRRSRAE